MRSFLSVYVSHDNDSLVGQLSNILKETAGNKPIEIFYKFALQPEGGWTPAVWDLIISILSMPANFGHNDNWYRLQSEQQMITKYNSAAKCLFYVQDVMVSKVNPGAPWAGFRVAQNIYSVGNWKEYHSTGDLASSIDEQVTLLSNKIYSAQEAEASWKKTIEQAVQTKIGARWIESAGHLAIDTLSTDSDAHAAEEKVSVQLLENIRRKANEFVPVAVRLNNAIGWGGFGGAATRFFAAVNVDAAEIPENLGNAYDALLELASFLEQDNELQKAIDSAADPLDPEVRRELRALIRTAAPWLRRFPTIRELDDECGSFLKRPELLEPAVSIIKVSRQKDLVSDLDAEATLGVLDAAFRGRFQGEKATARGVHTVRNLVIAGATAIVTFFSSAVSSDFATKSDLVQRVGSVLAEAEKDIYNLLDGMPDDIQIALRELIKELKQ